jgi:ABC-type glycerol-3-phosphate transport system permease component
MTRIAWVLAALVAAPLLWAAWGSLAGEGALFGGDAVGVDPGSYVALFRDRGFHRALQASFVVATLTTFASVALAAPAAYALARLPLRGARVTMALILAVSVLPQITVVGPLYLLLRALHLVDTIPGLVLPYTTFALPLAVWLLHATMRALPRELEEAALVEGASRARILLRIVLPLAAPGLATAGILTFVYCWNEFLFALAFTISPARRTVPVAIALLRGQHQVPWAQILAASVVATAPVAVVVLAFQRRVVAGLTAGSVKG